MRRIPALIGVVAIVSAALAGCAGAPDLGGCTPVHGSGDASSTVTAAGKVGSQPSVDFPTPLIAESAQVSTIHAGSGSRIQAGQQVDFEFTAYDGRDGQKLSATGTNYDGVTPARAEAGQDDSAITEALTCAQVGERLAVVTTAADALGESGASSNNVSPKSTVVIVVDIVAAYLGKADGINQLPLDGMPNVVTAVDGQPAVSVLLQSPPQTTRFSTIKAGGGTVLKAGDRAVVHFSGWSWAAGASPALSDFASTWTSHSARTLPLEKLRDTNFDGVPDAGIPAGIVDGLVGQKVGSQVLIVIPPGKDGFPQGTQGLPDGTTVIFVIDILGIQK
ncbi:MAG TPA: hypothetical protein VNT53_05215 [Pseudolysinimonas sp.]|nr:hypothetical protein [Pseudolysinimonas sp.]